MKTWKATGIGKSSFKNLGVSHLSNCSRGGITGHIWGPLSRRQGHPWFLTFQRVLGNWGQHGWRVIDRPAQVFHRLIDAQAVLPAFGGPKAIMSHLQASQDPHARLGQGVALDILMCEVRDHLLEVILQEGKDLLDRALSLWFDLNFLQRFQRLAGVLGVPAVAEDMPDTMQEHP